MKQATIKPEIKSMPIETYLPAFPGFYGTLFEVDFSDIEYNERGYIAENLFHDSKKIDLLDLFDNNSYQTEVSKSACNFIESELSDYIEKIEYQSLYSPKEYNFTNDSINCLITPKAEAIRAFIYANKEKFEEYLIDHLKSRSGFMSFYSHDFNSWIAYTNDFSDYTGKAVYLGFILDFIVLMIIDQPQYAMYEYVREREDIWESNFLDYSKYTAIVDEVTNFIQKNYGEIELIKQTFETYIEEGLLIDELIKHVQSEIDNKTGKLF